MEYTYYTDPQGNLQRLHVERDFDPASPRDDDGNIGAMFCASGKYFLGDEPTLRNTLDMKYTMLRDAGIPIKKVFDAAKKGTLQRCKLSYDRHSRKWDLVATFNGGNGSEGLCFSESSLEFLEDELMTNVLVADIEEISEGRLVALPVYLIDHSGITLSTTPFQNRWDSGQAGWIWTTKEKACRVTGIKDISQERMKEYLESEVTRYSKYLTADVYGYIVESYGKDGWKRTDSCWDFYLETLDPLKELSDKAFGAGNWSYDESELPRPKSSRADKRDLIMKRTTKKERSENANCFYRTLTEGYSDKAAIVVERSRQDTPQSTCRFWAVATPLAFGEKPRVIAESRRGIDGCFEEMLRSIKPVNPVSYYDDAFERWLEKEYRFWISYRDGLVFMLEKI